MSADAVFAKSFSKRDQEDGDPERENESGCEGDLARNGRNRYMVASFICVSQFSTVTMRVEEGCKPLRPQLAAPRGIASKA